MAVKSGDILSTLISESPLIRVSLLYGATHYVRLALAGGALLELHYRNQEPSLWQRDEAAERVYPLRKIALGSHNSHEQGGRETEDVEGAWEEEGKEATGEEQGLGNSKTIKPEYFITLYHARGTFISSAIIIPSGERAG